MTSSVAVSDAQELIKTGNKGKKTK
jgi:hypothetical protein